MVNPLPLNPFENIMLEKIQQHSTQPSASITFGTLIKVFVENFISSTNNNNNNNSDFLTHLLRCLLHGIHSIFRH